MVNYLVYYLECRREFRPRFRVPVGVFAREPCATFCGLFSGFFLAIFYKHTGYSPASFGSGSRYGSFCLPSLLYILEGVEEVVGKVGHAPRPGDRKREHAPATSRRSLLRLSLIHI